MAEFLQTLMQGLAVGSLYALIALGYTMVYGILKFINFAHSDVFVMGAWISFSVAMCAGFGPGEHASIAPWVPWVAGVFSAAAVGSAVYQRAIRKGSTGTSLSNIMVMMAIWAWALIALVLVTRGMRASGNQTLALAGGGMVLLVAMGTCGLLGFTVERLAYRPLRKAPRINVLITAIGVSLLLQNTGQLEWMFGKSPRPMPTLLQDVMLNDTTMGTGALTVDQGGRTVRLAQPIKLEQGRQYRLEITAPGRGVTQVNISVPRDGAEVPAGEQVGIVPAFRQATTGEETYRLIRFPLVPIRLLDVIGAGTAVGLMILLNWLVFGTKVGRAMRAVSFNPSHAALMGINVDRIISFTFVLGATLAAAAGFLWVQIYPATLQQPAAAGWVLLGLKAFVAAVVGGIGNIRGAMLGGVLIGVLEFLGAKYLSTELRDFYVFVLLIVVLLVRPSGIMGTSVTEKV